MNGLENLKPKKVFSFFLELCKIPHGSGNTKQISDFCVNFAKERGLFCLQDSLNNVIIKKDATAGYENHPPVILQGHLDMVCEKEPDCDIDFERDGLIVFEKDGFLAAKGTTLGGDDGIAVAMALAVLDSNDLAHPPLEAVFTVDEETGMYGAEGLDCSALSGKLLINIDSEDEGVLTVGCAGGARAELSLPFPQSPLNEECFTVTVSGLLGGHSGAEIDKGRLNSNRVLAEFLSSLPDFRLVDIEGGLKDNAIPARSVCTVFSKALSQKKSDEFVQKIKTECDPDLNITVESAGVCPLAADEPLSRKAVDFLLTLPNGIQATSEDITGLVETSLNLGILKTEKEKLCLSFAVRSSKNAQKTALLDKMETIAKRFGAEFSTHGHYPAWEYRECSRLRDTMSAAFENLYGRLPKISVIHAGLECGLFCDKIEGLDAVSFGPDMADIHTPRERLSIASVERSYNYLCEILKRL